MNKNEKEILRTEFSKHWNDERMTNYCTNQVSTFAVLPDGRIVTVDKQSIKKHFCFGEHGYDYDDASAAADYASKSTEYFKNENMKYFTEWINDLETSVNNGDSGKSWNSHVVLIRNHYNDEDCKLVSISFRRLSDVIEAFGGSCYLTELPEKTITLNRVDGYKIATKEEIQIILEAYRTAAKAHEKRVDTYLKKYGMSNVRTWTYWADA